MLPGGAQHRGPGWRRLHLYGPEPGRRGLLQSRVGCAFRWAGTAPGNSVCAPDALLTVHPPASTPQPGLQWSCSSPVSICPTYPASALSPSCSPRLTPGQLSPFQLRQLWRSRVLGKMRSIEEGDSATSTISTRRSAGVGPGGASVGGPTGLVALRCPAVTAVLCRPPCYPGVPSPTYGAWWSVAPAWSLQPSSSPARPSPRHQRGGRPGCWPGFSTTVSSTSTRPLRGAGDWSLSLSCILGEACA